MKKQVELSITHNGKDVVTYPYTKKEHVQFENGMNIDEFVGQDIATPTITHNTTAIKVGVGDSDVSSSVVDSTVNMTIKGQTYQNILPDPTLRNEMQGKSMQRLNEGYDSIETVDGVSKSAILKGQTLVNLATYSKRRTAHVQNLSESDGKLTWNTTDSWGKVGFTIQGKPNVDYYIRWGERHETLQMYVRFVDELHGATQPMTQLNSTSKKFTTNETGIFTLTLEQANVTTNSWIKNFIILEYVEGMENWDIPYFEGMTSCKMPVLQTVGKNLFDVNNVISGHITESAGFTPTDNNAKTIDWFYCKPNTSYTVSGGNRNRWILCNANGEETFIGGVGGNETPTITTLSDTVKFRCYVGYNAEPIDINNVQLEEGSVATTFESHKTNILTVNEEVELGSVGEVKDELNLLTGQLTQRTETRAYQEDDESNSEVLTDMTNTRYKLPKEVIKTVDLSILDQNGGTQENLHSFANGQLQVSSEAENSLLPTVQYEIPTKNSYHMDLMKTNTLYTMKAKSVSGTFTIDDTSYNVNANDTFTSPSSMTNKLLVMSNKTNEEVMLLEGNVIDKTIPYFKGIKSAFEGEDKIEVLSTGKNLFDVNLHEGLNIGEDGVYYFTSAYWGSSEKPKPVTYKVKPNTKYTLATISSRVTNNWLYIEIDGVGESINAYRTMSKTFTSNNTGIVSLTVCANNSNDIEKVTLNSIQLVEGSVASEYEPHKSNTTKIPLLSPLRSLPNGVCDELIIDRLNHKAKLIQRIGYEVLNENTAFSSYPTMEKEKTLLFQTQNANPQGASTYCISDQFIHRNSLWDSSDSDIEAIMIGGGKGNIGKRIDFRISKAKVSTNNVTILQDYLSKEPITVLYQLNIPIITEIDLEGYPYVYKGGHIFLNSDIAPTTQITYSINQAQQIESANENLQRHEKEISHLQKLIAQYIQVEYESTLLSLKI